MLENLAAKLIHSPEKDAALKQRLAIALASAKDKLDHAREAWSDAVADEAEDKGTPGASDKAEKALTLAKRDADKAAAALRAVDARQAKTAAGSERAALAEQWRKSETLTEARVAAANRLARSMKEFASDYNTLLRLTGDITAVLPKAPDMDAAWLRASQVETSVRKELLRLDVDWAYSWPWGKVSLTDFVEPFKGAVSVVKRWRDSALGVTHD